MPLYVRTLLVTGPPDEVDVASRGHRDHVRELRAKGRLHAAGEFANSDGFLEIFEARDLVEAQVVASASPLVAEGLATWMIREWVETSFDPTP